MGYAYRKRQTIPKYYLEAVDGWLGTICGLSSMQGLTLKQVAATIKSVSEDRRPESAIESILKEVNDEVQILRRGAPWFADQTHSDRPTCYVYHRDAAMTPEEARRRLEDYCSQHFKTDLEGNKIRSETKSLDEFI